MQKIDKKFSHKVKIISFIMAILIIYVHANNLKYYGLENNLTNVAAIFVNGQYAVFGQWAIPFFFFISGYWFFRIDVNNSSVKMEITNKIKRRVKTVVVPYILWNTFGMLFYMVITRIPILAERMNSGEVIGINLSNIINGIFFHRYYFTFWYMQDLIILIALSPLLFLVLKNKVTACMGILVLGILNYMGIDIRVCQLTSMLFFIVGGAVGIYARNWFEARTKYAAYYILIFVVFCITVNLNLFDLGKFVFTFMPIVIWKAMDFFISDNVLLAESKWFMGQSFFIYAMHVIPVTVIGHLFIKSNRGNAWIIGSYLVIPLLTLFLIYIIAKILYKYTPHFYRSICGGRI